MALDATKNFAKATVSTGYDDAATTVVLETGEGAKLPAPSTDGEFNLVWYNASDYGDPSDDPNVEIVRVTARSTDTLTITRAQESTTAKTHNTSGKTYRMVLAITQKMIEDIEASSGGASLWTSFTGTRASDTTITVASDVTAIFKKGMIIKWTDTTTHVGMVSIPSTESGGTTTITIIGDVCSASASDFSYCMLGAEMFTKMFAYAGTVGAVATGVANTITAMEPMRLIGADLWVGTAGTTNNTTVDININGTTAFTTKPTLATTVQSSPTPFTADDDKSLALGDDLTLNVVAIQATPAIDLYVKVYLLPTRYLDLT